ncbi:MAG: phenylalanine--tRNA ligase subunit beta [Candidatus Hadarchaeales archaeon]
MPVIDVSQSELERLLGRKVELPSILRCLDQLGLDTRLEGEKLEVEVTHNRPDLLSVEGLARVLKGMLGIETGLPRYKVAKPCLTLRVDRSVSGVRPIIKAGVVRNVQLDEEALVSIMQLQERLHETVCRRRRKASIGVYDLDTLQPPIYYRAVKPDEVSFVPLEWDTELKLSEILKKHPKGIAFAHLLEGLELFPLLQDSKGRVLSMPPIVNSEETKVTTQTKNLFVDVTGLDERAVTDSLNIMMCALAERGFKLEAVRMVPGGITPDLSPIRMRVDVEKASEYVGIRFSRKEAARILRRMRFEVAGETVLAPPYRTDLLHEVDLIEELAVGYGYDRLEPLPPRVHTIGEIHPLERLCGRVRLTMIGLGFTEVMNYILTSPRVNFELTGTGGEAVEIANPVSEEYTILRTWLLPSLLLTCQRNKIYELPQKFFEVGDVVLPEPRGESVRTIRSVGAVHVGGNFTQMKAVAEALLREVGLKPEQRAGEHPSFLEGRVLEYLLGGERVGIIGEIHPRVLSNFKLNHPVASLEIRLGERV